MNINRLIGWSKDYANDIARVAIVLVFLLLAIWAITLDTYNLVIGDSALAKWLTTALKSVAPELAGIVIGVVTIDYLNARRQQQELKKELILQLASGKQDVTDTALRRLKALGYLGDGTLKGADLRRANLENADLGMANLDSARLDRAILKNADLSRAILTNIHLSNTNLKNANLWEANLENATGWYKEQFRQAEYTQGLIMPDGVKLKQPGIQFHDEWIIPPCNGPNLDEWIASQPVDELADILYAAGQSLEKE